MCVERITMTFSPISLTRAVEAIQRMTPAQREQHRDEALAELVDRS